MTNKNFDEAFNTFVEGCQKILNDHLGKNFPELPRNTLEARKGRRYMKVVVVGGGVHVFVDKTNGDVLKPAGWSAPAKHARGNIWDDNNGLGSMGPYGPAYLKGGL